MRVVKGTHTLNYKCMIIYFIKMKKLINCTDFTGNSSRHVSAQCLNFINVRRKNIVNNKQYRRIFKVAQDSCYHYVCIYSAFSYDVTAAILVFQNKETAAILMYQAIPPGIKLYFYATIVFCFSKEDSALQSLNFAFLLFRRQ